MESKSIVKRDDIGIDAMLEGGIPVCAQDLQSPVVEREGFIDKIHYKIGNRMYVEEAPHGDVSPYTGKA